MTRTKRSYHQVLVAMAACVASFLQLASVRVTSSGVSSSHAAAERSSVVQSYRRQLQATAACFAQTSGTNFTLCGNELRFVGTNAYYLSIIGRPTDDQISTFFQVQSQRGTNVVRLFAFVNGYGGPSAGSSADYTPFPLQPSVGVFNETAMNRLDLVISEASKYNIRLILVLANYFNSLGGIAWYVDQVKGPGQPVELFYTDPDVVSAFKAYISNMLQRTNTITGLQYKDDPTIAAWDLMNEAQTTPFYEKNRGMQPGQLIAAWAADVAAFVRANDPNHMICMGDVAPPYQQLAYWGTDYNANIQIPEIDFGTMHLYPEGWGVPNTTYSQPAQLNALISPFFDQALNSTRAAGKPLMLQEYGCTEGYANRDIVLGTLQAAANARGLSTLVWQLTATPNAPGDGYNFGYGDAGTAAMKQLFAYVDTAAGSK